MVNSAGPATTLSSWARSIRSALEARGVPAAPLFQRAGLDLRALADPQARYPVGGGTRLWQAAVEVTGDPAFGLSASRYVMPTTFHALGYAVMASATLAEAFERIARYFRVITDAAEVTLVRERQVYRVGMQPRGDGQGPCDEALDAFAAVIVRMCRGLAGRHASPVEVRLRRKPPADPDPWRRLFRCPVRFGATDNQLVYARDLAERPLDGADPAVARLNEEAVARSMALMADAPAADQVRALVAMRLPSGDPGEDAVARVMHLSRRTLQRRLAEEGTGYRELVDELRRAHAESLVADAGRPLGEVAFLLGFSDVSAFTRAFRRWTGVPPGRWRRQRAGG